MLRWRVVGRSLFLEGLVRSKEGTQLVSSCDDWRLPFAFNAGLGPVFEVDHLHLFRLTTFLSLQLSAATTACLLSKLVISCSHLSAIQHWRCCDNVINLA